MQRPFPFRLLTFASIGFLLYAFSLSSCSRNASFQGKGEASLQGEWRQDSVPVEKKLTEYSLYDLKFSCDSFFIRINTFSKVNNGADTCTRSGHWTEYVKGTYEQKRDTLHVRGNFCNADYSIKEEGGCFRAGIYEENFILKKKGDSVLEFAGASSLIPIEAHLIKHTTCTPKPL
jgi:hypothetical protein